MAITSWIRRQFSNGVIPNATLNAALAAGVTTSFTLNSGQGATFPDGSVGPFITTLDQGLATEEQILVQSRSGDTFTIATNGRGYDGPVAQSHNAGASVLHTINAQDFDEANQTAVQTLGAITASGDLLVGSGSHTLARLAKGATNSFLQAGSSTLAWTGFGVGQSQSVGSSNTDGTQTTPARSDHTHLGTFNGRAGAVVPGNADYLAVAVGGLTGATATTRYVGGTASGPPTTGTFAVGDFVVDQTGIIWVCTVLGTPGTWLPANGVPISANATVDALQSTGSSTYTDLGGPAVTLTTGTAVKVTLTAGVSNSTASTQGFMGFAVSGATTLAPTDTQSLNNYSPIANGTLTSSAVYPLSGLTAGSNTFTAKYRQGAGGSAANFVHRFIIVERLN